MKALRGILASVLLIVALTAQAQIRTGGDIDSGTFIIGLDSYFCGNAGGLNFNLGSDPYTVTLGGSVIVVSTPGPDGEPVEQTVYDGGLVVPFLTGINLPEISGDFVVGVHDFTGDNIPELVIGVRNSSASGIETHILKHTEDGWRSIGEIAVFGISGVECRVFRHAITVKNPAKGALYTWTCHGDKFDFKASDGTTDPSLLIELPAEES
ncbi:MAG: hypothetical protein J6T02_04230 [Bacteroidales bacterium]|nr:hypothetical protein [Bacteroidales bacterium]